MQIDHVHLLVMVVPKISISDFVGIVKGRTAIRVFNKFRHLKQKPYWGNHFWSRGYCVDTVGLDTEKIRKYVKYQATFIRVRLMLLLGWVDSPLVFAFLGVYTVLSIFPTSTGSSIRRKWLRWKR